MYQCFGSAYESVGSVPCFWASRIRIRIRESEVRIRGSGSVPNVKDPQHWLSLMALLRFKIFFLWSCLSLLLYSHVSLPYSSCWHSPLVLTVTSNFYLMLFYFSVCSDDIESFLYFYYYFIESFFSGCEHSFSVFLLTLLWFFPFTSSRKILPIFSVLKFVFSLTCWLLKFFCISLNSSFFDTGYFYPLDCGLVIAVNSNYQSLKHRWALFLETHWNSCFPCHFLPKHDLSYQNYSSYCTPRSELEKIRAAAANIFKHILQLKNLSNTIRFCIPWCSIFRRIATGNMSCHFLCKNFLIRVFPIYSSLLKIAQCKAFRSCISFFYFCKKLIGTRLKGFFPVFQQWTAKFGSYD